MFDRPREEQGSKTEAAMSYLSQLRSELAQEKASREEQIKEEVTYRVGRTRIAWFFVGTAVGIMTGVGMALWFVR